MMNRYRLPLRQVFLSRLHTRDTLRQHRSPAATLAEKHSLNTHPVEKYSFICSRCFHLSRPFSKKPSRVQRQTWSDSDSDDSDDEHDDHENFPLHPDDGELSATHKELVISVNSNRCDAIVAKSLNMRRNDVDSQFLSHKLLHNEEILTKKAKRVSEGDSLDLVIREDIGVRIFKRVRVCRVLEGSDRCKVHVRVWKAAQTVNVEPD